MAQDDTMIAQPPDPALKRLQPMAGRWEMTGRTPGSAHDNVTGWSLGEWLPGGHFLKLTGEILFDGLRIESIEIIGIDPTTGTFKSMVYSNLSGEMLPYGWDVQGQTITHWDRTSKYTGTLSADGKTLTGGWRPLPGFTDETGGATYDVVMTKTG